MTASRKSPNGEAAGMCCWPELRPTWAYAPEFTFGWGWIGTLRAPPAYRSCLSVDTSASESHSNFGCTSKKGGNDEHKEKENRPACSARLDSCRASGSSANQAHRNARRRHDLKFLSLWCETTPGTPVWRSKSRSELAGRKSRCHPQGGRTDRSCPASQGDIRQRCDRCGDGYNRTWKNRDGLFGQPCPTDRTESVVRDH